MGRASSIANRRGSATVSVVAVSCVLFAGLLAAVWVSNQEHEPSTHATGPSPAAVQPDQSVADHKFSVTIRKPDGPPRVLTGVHDANGQPVTVACSTCHSARKPNINNKRVADLDEFHRGMPLAHGTISCLSCHNSTDYDALKLADGTRVEFTDVMTLCAQCHGPQMRDYEHGAHGGMNGYWDLSRGPQTKNNCVDCHNPHVPKFPTMQPTFKPRDRFLDKEHH